MKKILSIAFIACITTTFSFATSTINLALGTIYSTTNGSTPAAAGSLLVLLAKTNGSWGTDLDIYNTLINTTSSFVPSGSFSLIGKYALNNGLGTGTYSDSVVFDYNGYSSGNEFLAVLYPTLTTGSAAPGQGTIGAFFRTDLIIDGSDIAWVVPADGGTVGLNGGTVNLGGSLAANTFYPGDENKPGFGGGHGFTTVPEPATYALLAMSALAMGGYMIRRRRR